jgi:serine/threonine-protein kinase
MKHLILRTSAALACAAALASCGGGSTGTLQIGGSVSGVTQDGLVIQNNGGSDLAIAANQNIYVFKDLVPTDSVFNITFKTLPPNVKSCAALPAQGNTGLYSVTVTISCVITPKDLKGTVTGLNGRTGLILANGPNQVPVAADGPFTMAQVSLGSPYGINVLRQPDNATCTVTNGVGTIADNVSNVIVTCV